MPNNQHLEWLQLKQNANDVEIQQALQNKWLELQQANKNQLMTQQYFQHQLDMLTNANQQLNNNKASRDHYHQEIKTLQEQMNQQAISLTTSEPNNTPNYTCSLKLPSNTPTPKPGQFFSSWRAQDWLIAGAAGVLLSPALQKQIANRLHAIDNKIYSEIEKLIPGLQLSKPYTNDQGLTTFTFTSNGNPLTSTQQADVQKLYNEKYNNVAASLSQPGDPFKIQMGPPKPGAQLQQQAQQTQPSSDDSLTSSISRTPTLRPPGAVQR